MLGYLSTTVVNIMCLQGAVVQLKKNNDRDGNNENV